MSFRLFEGKDHASIYQQFRLAPPDQVKDVILQYLDKKKGQPHVLALDLGCGTGQNSRLLAPHFQEVVAMDISKSQLEEARNVPGYHNITYREGAAEELPFPDGSVDLITAASAAHWFDQSRFLAEACRVLKPRGCMALLGFTTNFRVVHKNCGETLNYIYEEVRQALWPYTSSKVAISENKLEDLYAAIPFPEKERIDSIRVRQFLSVRNFLGLIKSWSMFQAYWRNDQKGAEDLLLTAEKRILEQMGVTSTDKEITLVLEYFCILASKPA